MSLNRVHWYCRRSQDLPANAMNRLSDYRDVEMVATQSTVEERPRHRIGAMHRYSSESEIPTVGRTSLKENTGCTKLKFDSID